MKKLIVLILIIFSSIVSAKEVSQEKEKDILDFIRVSILAPETLDLLVPTLVSQAAASIDKEVNTDELTIAVKEHILSDNFLKKFAPDFDKIFSHNEIKDLISFYKSDAMRKFYKNSKNIPLIYPEITNITLNIAKNKYGAKEKSLDDGNVVVVTKSNYDDEVKNYSGSAVLEIYAPYCGPCKRMAPIFSQLSNEIDDVKFLKLNIENDPQVSKELKVHSLPTFLFLKDGKVIDKHVGSISKEELRSKIKQNLL